MIYDIKLSEITKLLKNIEKNSKYTIKGNRIYLNGTKEYVTLGMVDGKFGFIHPKFRDIISFFIEGAFDIEELEKIEKMNLQIKPSYPRFEEICNYVDSIIIPIENKLKKQLKKDKRDDYVEIIYEKRIQLNQDNYPIIIFELKEMVEEYKSYSEYDLISIIYKYDNLNKKYILNDSEYDIDRFKSYIKPSKLKKEF